MLPIPGYPHYEISSDGRVFRIGSSVPLRPVVAKRGGYLQVGLWKEGKGYTCYVHQLVAFAYHGPRPSPRHHAAHRDGRKLNNTAENVQWITKEENEADKIRHGTSNRGERNGSAKLTDAQAAELRARVPHLPRSSGGAKLRKGTLQMLAAEYGLTTSGVWQVINDYRRSAQ
jgi:hypothetical protein